MKRALSNIDQGLREIESKYTHYPIMADGWNMWRVCNQDLKKPGKLLDTAKRMVLHLGFLESLSSSLVTFMSQRGKWNFWWYPFRLMTDDYYQWKKSLRFGKLINDFKLTRTKVFLSSKRAKLDYWLGMIEKSPNAQVKVYSAKDDFLNDPQSWDKLSIQKSSLIMKDKGGHLGYMDQPAFIDLLRQIYQK